DDTVGAAPEQGASDSQVQPTHPAAPLTPALWREKRRPLEWALRTFAATRPHRTTRLLTLNNVPIEDTFSEAFPMTAARLVVTAETADRARTAGQVTTGYAASVIGCDAEAGVER